MTQHVDPSSGESDDAPDTGEAAEFADANVKERPEDVHLSAPELLAGHLLVRKGSVSVSEGTRHPNPNPSALAKVQIRKLLPLVGEFQRVENTLQEGKLSKEHRRVFEDARGLGMRSIMDIVRALIDVDPTCVTYTSEQEIVVSLIDGLELALFSEMERCLPKHRLRGKAVKWMIERGEGEDLNNLPAAVERAIAEPALIPENCFGLWRPSILIRNNPKCATSPR